MVKKVDEKEMEQVSGGSDIGRIDPDEAKKNGYPVAYPETPACEQYQGGGVGSDNGSKCCLTCAYFVEDYAGVGYCTLGIIGKLI